LVGGYYWLYFTHTLEFYTNTITINPAWRRKEDLSEKEKALVYTIAILTKKVQALEHQTFLV
jgi:hypothetical protein